MTHEEAKEIVKRIKGYMGDGECWSESEFMAMDMAIKALSQEPCDNAVSRKAVLEQIFYSTDNDGDVVLGSTLRRRIENLPFVTQKSGKWIEDEYGNVICSGCKRFRRDCRYGHTNYCNHCGAKMVEPQERSDKE